MILLLYLHLHLSPFISMVSNMVIFLKLWLNRFKIYLHCLFHIVSKVKVMINCLL
jgi:hypothetical protein